MTDTIVADRLAAAREELAEAEAALGAAQLEAIRIGKPLPGKAVDRVTAAAAAVRALQAAAAAAVVQAAAAASEAHAEARRARREAVEKTITDSLAPALQELQAGFAAIAESGAGQRARDALVELRRLVADASDSVLTSRGWYMGTVLPALRHLRVPGESDLVESWAGDALDEALAGTKPDLAARVTAVRAGLSRDLDAQPAEWPVTP
jgi:hypothetical protein